MADPPHAPLLDPTTRFLATSPQYTVSAADLGHALRCEAFGRSDDVSQAAFSAALPVAPVLSAPPVLGPSGSPHAVGYRLVCEGASWQGLGHQTSASLSYAWLRDGQPIPGANSGSYVATTEDVGHEISCAVAAVDQASEYPWTGMPVSEPTETTSAPVTIVACHSNQAPYCVLPDSGAETNNVFDDFPVDVNTGEITGLLSVTGTREESNPDVVHLAGTLQLDVTAPETIEVEEGYFTDHCVIAWCELFPSVWRVQRYVLTPGHHELVIEDSVTAEEIAHSAIPGPAIWSAEVVIIPEHGPINNSVWLEFEPIGYLGLGMPSRNAKRPA